MLPNLQAIIAAIGSQLATIPFPQLGLTSLDFIIIAVILFYAYEGFVLGFLLASFDLVSFILSFIIALKGYSFFGSFLANQFKMPQGFANAISFFAIALIAEVILNILFRRGLKKLHASPPIRDYMQRFQSIDHYAGLIPGTISALIILSFLLTVVISLPSSPYLKQVVTKSTIGSRLITHAASAEKTLNNVFGGALHETLNFLTIEPQSGETLKLNFTVVDPIVDPDSEQEMLAQVNMERRKAGLSAVVVDSNLRTLARAYARDMLQGGYFSHYNALGQSPFERMDAAGITYISAGENLALAPTVDLAMQGLMNSPGHKANILSPSFGHIGVGVMDGGIYGKMFVQEFTD